MSNVLSMWKQRSYESQAPLVALDGNSLALTEERSNPTGSSTKGKLVKDNIAPVVYVNALVQPYSLDAQDIPRPATNISGGTLGCVIRGSDRVVDRRIGFRLLHTTSTYCECLSSKRRLSELPAQSASSVNEQPRTTYMDQAAERRSLYGSSSFCDVS
ncbi:hypothetical protein Tco_1127463 [Tanacetum coccineum]